jgi:hypothetical protein
VLTLVVASELKLRVVQPAADRGGNERGAARRPRAKTAQHGVETHADEPNRGLCGSRRKPIPHQERASSAAFEQSAVDKGNPERWAG